MNNWQETLLFPIATPEARKQFMIASLVSLAGLFIPLIPTIALMGYATKITRQVVEDRKPPTMPEWQGINWSELLTDGIRIFGVQIVLMFPFLLLLGCSMTTLFSGTTMLSVGAEQGENTLASLGGFLTLVGFMVVMLFSLLSLPYQIIIGAALPHSVVKNSFSAGLSIKEWLPIFRKGMSHFILGYVVFFAVNFVLVFVMQILMVTIVLICLLPFLLVGVTTYQILIQFTVQAQAYATGLDALQQEQHASA